MSQPLRNVTPAQNPTPSIDSEKNWNRRIIVVDDEKEIANSYQLVLSSNSVGNVTPIRRSSRSQSATPNENSTLEANYNYEITVCYNAADALLNVRNAIDSGKPYAMGFFDVRLGEGMDGIELVKEIHKIDPNLFAVFVTAYQDRSVDKINQFLGKNAEDKWDYLNKPFAEGEIIQKARNTTALWNLKKEKESQDALLEDLHKRIREGERLNSVAVVARGVAHEFGNILMQISGLAEINKDGEKQEMQQAFEKILTASDVAANILSRFKNMGAPSQENVRKEIIPASLPLDQALQLMEYQLRSTNTKVCKIRNDKTEIYACTTSLIQVFVNLTINAIHAMGNGGQIDYSVVNVDNKWVDITVHDYGPGIPKDIIHKIMEPFFTTKGNKGTGLGLAICKEIIEIEHGGELRVQNNPHKGAEFIIRLPIDKE